MVTRLPLALRWLAALLAAAALVAMVTGPARAVSATDRSPGALLPASALGSTWPVALEPHLEATEDPGGRYTAESVRALPASHWKPTGSQAPHYALSTSVWWLRWRLHNPGPEPVRRIVELPEPLHDQLDFYAYPAGDSSPSTEVHTGDRRPYASRGIVHPGFAFPVTVPAQGELEVYLRLSTHDGLHEATPLRLWDEASFHRHAGHERLVFGLYYGALLALLLYNLFLFASTRDTLFGRYALYLAVFFVWNSTFRGLAYEFVWPRSPWLQNQLVALATLASFAALAWFSTRFMEIDTRMPRVHRLLRWLTAVLALVAIAPLLGHYARSWWLIIPAGMAVVLVLSVAAVVLALRGSRMARTWLLAWSVLSFTVALYYLRMLGVLPASFITEQGMQIGSALEFVLLAFGLADRMNMLKAEKLAAERTAHEAKARLSKRLEGEVRERTRELEVANRRLTEMAITDELTGAHNRRHFNEVLARALGRHDRQGGLALALLDIDHFKAFNDRYGHQSGDRALQTVSRVAQSLLRRSSDHFFRVGGEEFALIFRAPNQAQAAEFVSVLRETLERIGIEHAGSPHGHLSVSAGVLFVPPGDATPSPETVYARADALLYRAKSSGRNRVVNGELTIEPTAAA